MKTLGFIAKTLTRPEHHPLHAFASHARATTVTCHHNPFQRFFQSPLSEEFDAFLRQKTIDPTVKLTKPPNYTTLLQKADGAAARDAKSLKPSSQHLITYTDGSHLLTEYTGAAAWCENTDRSMSETLGPARTHGIFEAEYRGLQLGLTLILRHASRLTCRATVLMDNQSFILDIKS